jgi:nitrate reductase gamma subunit
MEAFALLAGSGATEHSKLLEYAAYSSHLALVFMGIVYSIRIYWLTRYTAGKERQAPTGTGSTKPWGSIFYSWAMVAMPWAMESTRTRLFVYLQFVVFHLGIAAAIVLSFIIPFVPVLLEYTVIVSGFQIVMGGAFLVGLIRIVRRVGSMRMRAISTPDDYFSLLLLTCWLFFAVLAAPNQTAGGEWHILAYFFLLIFFLVYVPFSKISHYLYYPFTRYYFGKTMGRRGVYPLIKGN